MFNIKKEKPYLRAPLLLALLAYMGFSTGKSYAADGEGSLDSMWKETSNSSSDAKAEEPVKSSAQAKKSSMICPLDSFLSSDIVQAGGWPKLGPFKAQGSNPCDLTDKASNRLALSVANEQITAAQLDLAGAPKQSDSMLKLQISTDFLLEGLGARQSKIHQFNLEFEKAVARFKGTIAAPVRLASGPYRISLVPTADASYRVRVIAEDMGKEPSPSKPVEKTSMIPKTNQTAADATSSDTSKESADASNSTDAASSNSTSTSTNKSPSAGASKNDKLKQEFLSVIQSWQNVKKKAIRQADTTELNTALAGRALARQTDAVTWLATNHKYYDMVPKGSTVERVAEVEPDKKYSVSAQVRENTKYIDEKKGQVLKESEDTYHVMYTVEKIDNHWFITDWSIIKSASPPATPGQAPKGHH